MFCPEHLVTHNWTDDLWLSGQQSTDLTTVPLSPLCRIAEHFSNNHKWGTGFVHKYCTILHTQCSTYDTWPARQRNKIKSSYPDNILLNNYVWLQ